MSAKKLPTRRRVLELLDYNPASGVFTWAQDRYACNGKVLLASKGDVAGTRSWRNGWVVSIDGKQYKAHRVAWLVMTGRWPKKFVDHRDGCNTNNKWANLRDVSNQVNIQNLRRAMASNKSSGLLGVSATRSRLNPWKAQIRIGGKITHLGSFPTPDAAHAAYVSAKRVHHEGCTL